MACAGKCAKVLLIIFNVIFWLLGAGALAAGVLVMTLRQKLTGWLDRLSPTAGDIAESADEGLVRAGAITLCVVGAIIIIIAFLGCCGAVCESKPMLAIYSLIVFLLLAAEIAGAVVAYLMRDKVEAYVQKFVNQTIAEKYVGLYFPNGAGQLVEQIDELSDGVDFAQIGFQCCGLMGPNDFSYASKWNKDVSYTDGAKVVHNVTAVVPITCCKLRKAPQFEQITKITVDDFVDLKDCLMTGSEASTNRKGCYNEIKGFLMDNIWIIFGIGIGIAFVELFGLVCACCLLFAKSDDDNKA